MPTTPFQPSLCEIAGATSIHTSSIIDLTSAPYHLDPTGTEDCTDSIVAALDAVLTRTIEGLDSTLSGIAAMSARNGYFGASCENRKEDGQPICIFPEILPYAPTLYFPPGEYLVSDTIGYTLEALRNSLESEMSWQIRFRGAGRDQSVIRLRDHSPGFSGPRPKPVVTFMRAERTNVAMSNYFEGLTIDTGSGNSSAIGLDFYANNSGAARDLIIRSGDGRGFAGLSLGHANYSGILIKNIQVNGFDYGCHFDSKTKTMFFAGEHIAIRRTRIAGIRIGAISASLRKIDFDGQSPALLCDDPSGLTVLVDSNLKGSSPVAIEHREGVLYADNVRVTGFERPLISESAFDSVPPSSSACETIIRDLAIPRRCDDRLESTTERLPVEETPVFERGPHGRTVAVQDYGAKGDGIDDDSPAIQAAMNSGASEIVFEPGRYRLAHPISIPANVERVNFNFSDLIAAKPLREMSRQGAFQITGKSVRPLFVEALFAWEQWSGEHVTFDHASTRTLVIRDVHTQTLCLYENSVSGGRVFLENVAATAGVIPGQQRHGRCCARFRGQQVWARQFNPERGEPMVLNDGGALWVLGFKSEDEGVAFQTVNGGKTEVLGGVLNGGGETTTAFLSEDSAIRVSAVSNGWESIRSIGTAVAERRNGQFTARLRRESCLDRGFPPDRGEQFCVSLYASPKIPE